MRRNEKKRRTKIRKSWLDGGQETRGNLADIEEDSSLDGCSGVTRQKPWNRESVSTLVSHCKRKGANFRARVSLNSGLKLPDLRDEIFQYVLSTCSWKGRQFPAPSTLCPSRDRWKTSVWERLSRAWPIRTSKPPDGEWNSWLYVE